MKESVAITKEADAKKSFSPTRSDKSINHARNEPDRQLGSLMDVIDSIRSDGGTPSMKALHERHVYRTACTSAFGTAADAWQPVCAAGGDRDLGEACGRAARGFLRTGSGQGGGCGDVDAWATGASASQKKHQ